MALVFGKTPAAVEFDGRITVVDLEVQELRAVLARSPFGKIKKPRANSLPAMGRQDEELIDPRAFPAVLQAKIEANDEVPDGGLTVAGKIEDAVNRMLQELGEVFSCDRLAERQRPGIVGLHVAHEREHRIEIGGSAEL